LGVRTVSTLIRTDQVPAPDRLDFVQEMTATTWVPMECRAVSGDYRGEFRASGLGAMQVVVMDIMPITVRRTPQLISQADPDLLKMVLVCGGNSCVVAQDGRQARLAADEFAIYDTRRPYEVACGVGGEWPTQMMTFMFPPSLLPLTRNRLRQLAAVRFPASAGLGDLTSQFLLQLARNVDHYSPAEAARLSAAALEVLAASATSRRTTSPPASRSPVLRSIWCTRGCCCSTCPSVSKCWDGCGTPSPRAGICSCRTTTCAASAPCPSRTGAPSCCGS
jgi:hypothetical protein